MRGVCLSCGVRFDAEHQYGYEGCMECGLDAVQPITAHAARTFEDRLTDTDAFWLVGLRIKLKAS